MLARRDFIKWLASVGIIFSFDKHLQNSHIIPERQNRKECFISTGFRDLDGLINGFQTGELVVIAGNHIIRKDAFLIGIVRHVAVDLKMPVALFSISIPIEQLCLELLASEFPRVLRTTSGNIKSGNWEHLSKAAEKLSASPIYVIDGTDIYLEDYYKKILELKSNFGIPCLIVIDYLNLVKTQSCSTKGEKLHNIACSLKDLAKRTGSGVIALISTAMFPDWEEQPILSDPDLKNIEPYTDKIIFLHKKNITYSESLIIKSPVKVVVAKNINGMTGTVYLTYREEIGWFVNYCDIA